MLGADFFSEKVEGFNVVDQCIEVEVFEISAWCRRTANCLRPVLRPAGLLARGELLIEAANMIGEKSAAVTRTQFQIWKPVKDTAVKHKAEGKRGVGWIAADYRTAAALHLSVSRHIVRMHQDQHVQLLCLGPEWIKVFAVVITMIHVGCDKGAGEREI